MQITAFNTPQHPSWPWRIVNYSGEIIAESGQGFASIHHALVHRKERLAPMNVAQVQAVKLLSWRLYLPVGAPDRGLGSLFLALHQDLPASAT